jgi:hypothetical protein
MLEWVFKHLNGWKGACFSLWDFITLIQMYVNHYVEALSWYSSGWSKMMADL